MQLISVNLVIDCWKDLNLVRQTSNMRDESWMMKQNLLIKNNVARTSRAYLLSLALSKICGAIATQMIVFARMKLIF